MVTEKQLALVGRIYEVPLQPDKWTPVLDEFAGNVGAAGASLHVFDMSSNRHKLDVLTTNYLSKQGEVAISDWDKVGKDDQTAYQEMLRYCDQEFRSDFQLIGIHENERSDVLGGVNWLRNYFGVDHRAACRLNLHGAWTDVLAVQFALGRGAMTIEEQQAGSVFVPHWARAVELHRTFLALRTRYNAALAALDHLHIGICVMSHYGDLVMKNLEIERISDAYDGFSFTRSGGIHINDEEAFGQFRDAIDQALRTAKGTGAFPGKVIAIPRRSGEDPFLVEVMPLRDTAGELDRNFLGALVVLIDPTRTDKISTEGMASIYRLTGAESEICRLIALGMETDEVADTKNISRETVRTHVKRILEKTSTNNRAQLVRLAHKVNLPIG